MIPAHKTAQARPDRVIEPHRAEPGNRWAPGPTPEPAPATGSVRSAQPAPGHPTHTIRGRSRARRRPATVSKRNPAKPTNNGVLSRLSRRNSAARARATARRAVRPRRDPRGRIPPTPHKPASRRPGNGAVTILTPKIMPPTAASRAAGCGPAGSAKRPGDPGARAFSGQRARWLLGAAPHAGCSSCWRLCAGEAFGPLLDGELHLAFHHPRAWFDDRVRVLVLYRQGGGVEAVPADQPGMPVGWPQLA